MKSSWLLCKTIPATRGPLRSCFTHIEAGAINKDDISHKGGSRLLLPDADGHAGHGPDKPLAAL
jgi:hypothetical protein